MITNLEIIHAIIGFGLFQLTWEFVKKYFYTKSENEILTQNRSSDIFSGPAITLIIVQICLFSAGCFLGKLFF